MTTKALHRLALPAAFSLAVLMTAVALSGLGSAGSSAAAGAGEAPAPSPPSNGAISPQDEADSLHYVIAADREVYSREFAARRMGGAPSRSSGGGDPGAPWPAPAEMLRRAAESIQSEGAEFSYALRSLHPTEPRDGPQTDLERQGLAFVAGHPGQNYYGREMLGGRRYFTAVYPDIPAEAGEVTGGIVVRVPLEF